MTPSGPRASGEPPRPATFSQAMQNVTPGRRTRSDPWGDPVRPEPRGGGYDRENAARLRRLRAVSWFLDRSIPVGRWRIGIDPLLGLVPGAGDWIGGILSLYVFYEGARLGVPNRVLTRMAGNILVETLFGAVPILGDLFDFAWQANMRNVALIERHYRPDLRARSLQQIGWFVVLFAALVLMITAGLFFLVFKAIRDVFN